MDEDPFTLEGYNENSQQCLEDGCGGLVELTRNVNVGECSSCGARYDWADYHKLRKTMKPREVH